MISKYMEIYRILEQLKHQSHCIDKQVACILTDEDYNILSYGINTILDCNVDCDDKENRICKVRHAEIDAIDKINHAEVSGDLHLLDDICYVFVNLYPCAPCQRSLMSSCRNLKKIISFTPQHKEQVFDKIEIVDNISDLLLEYDGPDKQLDVIQGELAELIKVISDFFARDDKDIHISKVLDEIIDVELMLIQLKRILWTKDRGVYNMLRIQQKYKYIKVMGTVKRLLQNKIN